MSTAMTLKSDTEISTEMAGDYDALAKGADFLGRLQLFTKGKYIDQGLVKPGHWGIPTAEDKAEDLGEVDIVPLARRLKAMDFSDGVITNYDPESAEFKRIQEQSEVKDSNCVVGISFLVFERSTGRFLEWYANSKSARIACKDLFPFLPTPNEAGEKVLSVVRLKSKYISKTKYPFHAPVIEKSSVTIKLPSAEKINAEIHKFVNPKAEGGEVVNDEPAPSGKAKRKR